MYRVLSQLLHQPPPNDPSLQQPVFVTAAESKHFTSLQNQTIATIDNQTESLIGQIVDPEHLQHFNKNVFSKQNDVHIDHYMELLSSVAAQPMPLEVNLDQDSQVG